MRKIVILVLAIILPIYASAQSCRIGGAEDGSSIQVNGNEQSGDFVSVFISNDSSSISANVTISINAVYQARDNDGNILKNYKNLERTYTGRVLAKSCMETVCKVNVPVRIEESSGRGYWSLIRYEIQNISGFKCQ